MLYTLELVLDM